MDRIGTEIHESSTIWQVRVLLMAVCSHIIVRHHPPSTIVNHHHPSSPIIIHRQPSSPIITHHSSPITHHPLPPPTESTFQDQYVAALYNTITTLSTMGYGDMVPVNTSERIVNIFVLIFGASMFSYVVANISDLVQR